MGIVTLSKQNHLFWLGRYAERVYTTVQYMLQQYDRLIDGEDIGREAFCRNMGIPCTYTSDEDFCRRYLFDGGDPSSVRSSLDAMLGNGMVLRETITTPTLAYLQMAQYALDIAERSDGPAVALQWVLDDIMAFRGSFDDSVEDEATRNVTKSGICVERISLILRLNWQTERLEREVQKMLNRLYKTGLTVNPAALDLVERCAVGGEAIQRRDLLGAVEGLFLV